jgi:hypothetical protein
MHSGGAHRDSGRGRDHQHCARLEAPGCDPLARLLRAGRGSRTQDRRQGVAALCAHGEQQKRARQQPQPSARSRRRGHMSSAERGLKALLAPRAVARRRTQG